MVAPAIEDTKRRTKRPIKIKSSSVFVPVLSGKMLEQWVAEKCYMPTRKSAAV